MAIVLFLSVLPVMSGETLADVVKRGSLRGVIQRSPDGRVAVRTPSGDNFAVAPGLKINLLEGVPLKFDKLEVRNGLLDFAHAHADLSKEAVLRNFGQLSAKSKDALTDLSGRVEKYREMAEKNPGRVAEGEKLDVEAGLGRARRETAHDYAEAIRTGDRVKADEAIRSTRSIQIVEKQIYNLYDNYPPEDYRKIYENTKGGVALAFNNVALCSAVLIGPDLVLTAGHCFKNQQWESAEVWFNYSPEGLTRGVKSACSDSPIRGNDLYRIKRILSPAPERVLDLAAGRLDHALLDYALIEVEPGQHGRKAGECWPAQCLTASRELSRREALYVIGHPQRAPQTVHDNSRVFLPFQVVGSEFDVLKADIAAELDKHPKRDELAKEFTSSYRETKDSQGRSSWSLYDVRQQGQPRIGIEADTFGGNSGSPVYERRNHCIAALFVSGSPDFAEPPGGAVGWARHESALPISVIVKDLDAQLKTWRDLGVVIR
ncbi:MAG: trypsin-like peptidase domain-containing protein [Bryobacteraceae bacterium]|nr:trypsin-like peptidase domain-containing protein [Bryobacteraceae bacterium]